MSVDGQDGESTDVTTGLPQGLPTSPALFAIYITKIHEVVENQVNDGRVISFVDDVTVNANAIFTLLVFTQSSQQISH